MDSVEGAIGLASQTSNILCYLPPSNLGKNASQFASVTSEEIIQINFLWCILSHNSTIQFSNQFVAVTGDPDISSSSSPAL